MRVANNAKFSHQDTEGREGQQSLARFFKRSPSVLALPKLNQNVPTRFTQGSEIQNLAILALNLMRHGLIEENATGETVDLVLEAAKKWVADCAGELEYFGIGVKLSPDLNDLEHVMLDTDLDDYIEQTANYTGKSPMYFRLDPNVVSSLTIGEKLQAIEDKIPGLGKTAYYWLALTGARTCQVYTPWSGSEMARMTWWHGEDNQADYLEMLEEFEDPNEDPDMEEDDVSPDAWKNAFPAWVTSIEKPLNETDLETIVKTHPETLESQVATVVLALIKNQEAQLPNTEATNLIPVYNSVWLLWRDGDMASRLIDDFINEANMYGGEGYTDILGLCAIPYQKKQFDVWFAEMSAGFKQLKNLDNLIHLIGIRNN